MVSHGHFRFQGYDHMMSALFSCLKARIALIFTRLTGSFNKGFFAHKQCFYLRVFIISCKGGYSYTKLCIKTIPT